MTTFLVSLLCYESVINVKNDVSVFWRTTWSLALVWICVRANYLREQFARIIRVSVKRPLQSSTVGTPYALETGNRHSTNATEVLWCSLSRRQHQISADPVRIRNTDVLPVQSVRDLRVYIDADVTMRVHVTTVVQSCFAALPRIHTACTSTSRLTDISACLDCHQGVLLQFASRGNVHATSWLVAVSSKCCCLILLPLGPTASLHCSGTSTGCMSLSTR